ncbi:MAG: phosphatidate cytidylyltransferase [Ruminococcaceae bacterium]|nr:phosphatidate cytidylyltransferase [Oscillospiraceae bacterium]
MKTRVLTAIVMVAVMVPFFVFSQTVAFPILMGFLSLVGVIEMQQCIGVKRHPITLLPLCAVAGGLPFLARYVGEAARFSYLFAVVFSVLTFCFIVSVFSGKAYPVDQAAMAGASTVYIAVGFAAVVMLRDLPFGEYIYFLAFIIPWVTDTFAYFSGRLFGKHKLIPEVSPKKTVEGSVGGTLFAVLLTALYGFIVGLVSEAKPNYLALVIVAAVVSVLAQCGDLVMSLIKRKFGIKDYGKLFPGHGGVLDRFDSILVTAPFLYFLIDLIPALSLFA